VTLYIDIETKSRIDLKKSNAYRYCEDPDWGILFACWAVDDEPVQVAFTTEEIMAIPGLWDGTEKVAHNAAFERINFTYFIGSPGDPLDPGEWTCTQALAGEHGHPQKLEKLGHALGGEEKSSAGTALISFFCKPNRKGEFNKPEDHPEKWAEFVEYGIQDVVTLRDVHKRLPGWPNEAERQAYIADQKINDNGIAVDVEMAQLAIAAADGNAALHIAEIQQITGIDNPNSGPQMLGWLREQDMTVTNLKAETVAALLEEDLDPSVRRVLELRQELALVAMKKYTAALDRVNEDNRLRGAFHFFGAHTGRWAGRGVQLQNLPSATIKPQGDEHVDTAIAAAVLDLRMGADMSAHTLKALVRAMFVGPFTVVDYAAIEARVLAWLAGEEWALQAFRDGRDIYVETANRMGNGMTRKDGKVATLALGYNGGIMSLRHMGAEGDDKRLQRLVYQWRDANEMIVGMWAEMEAAFRKGDRSVGDRLYIERDEKDRRIVLPSGRAIVYHNVAGRWEDTKYGRKQKIVFTDPAYYPAKSSTYGGKLAENVTQAVARDILSEALVRLLDRGHTVVGHVHDEILVEGFADIDEISKIMVEQPTWAEGLPLSAEGFTAPRYRKD